MRRTSSNCARRITAGVSARVLRTMLVTLRPFRPGHAAVGALDALASVVSPTTDPLDCMMRVPVTGSRSCAAKSTGARAGSVVRFFMAS